MEMKPQTVWASVVIVFILVSAATTLVVLNKDYSIILTLAALVGMPVLAAFGVTIYHKLEQVKEASNGAFSKAVDAGSDNFNKMMEMQQETQKQWQEAQKQLTALAMAFTPVAPVSPAAVPEEPKPPEEFHGP